MSGKAHLDPLVDQETLYSSRNPTRRWLHVARREWVLHAVRRYAVNRCSRALEVGAGAGIYLPSLASLCERATAFDREQAPELSRYVQEALDREIGRVTAEDVGDRNAQLNKSFYLFPQWSHKT